VSGLYQKQTLAVTETIEDLWTLKIETGIVVKRPA
jgi:hypothetical protein